MEEPKLEQEGQVFKTLAAVFIDNTDPSHDFAHAERVVGYVRVIQAKEGGDLRVLIPAAWFHDVVHLNDGRSSMNWRMSAIRAREILEGTLYPKELIPLVEAVIACSGANGAALTTLESRILHDADLLESVGAFAIMRYASSSQPLQRRFVNPHDPLCANRVPITDFRAQSSIVDVIIDRTPRLMERFSTQTARDLARERLPFLLQFLQQLKRKLADCGVLEV